MSGNTGESSNFILFMNVTNTLTQMMLGGIAIGAICFASFVPGQNNLSQHIYLCVIGYVIMMTQAILTFSPHNGWSVSLRQEDKKVVHWVLQVIGAIFAITGSAIRMSNLTINLQYAHGIFGLVALILTVVSLVGGLVNLFIERTTITNFLHSGVGALTLVCAFIGLCLGFDKTIFRLFMGQTAADLLIALTAFALCGTLLSAGISNGKKLFRR